MANAADKTALITENLIDMGLDERSVSQCLSMITDGKYTELEKYLAKYRKELLDNVHQYNSRIDCLDYFTYTLKKTLEVQ